ncbi:hypothetical protein Adt_15472 [Abeliophyllum distichum]|uniref:Uncharacterized protein n=1 Tax=Abeliophyllum distichum TaxID=126358 RepID=A0ABD1U2J6_9LAMI
MSLILGLHHNNIASALVSAYNCKSFPSIVVATESENGSGSAKRQSARRSFLGLASHSTQSAPLYSVLRSYGHGSRRPRFSAVVSTQSTVCQQQRIIGSSEQTTVVRSHVVWTLDSG